MRKLSCNWCVPVFAALLLKAQDPMPENPATLIQQGADQKEALRIHPAIYQAIGFGNTFLVTTSAGNVIIDTSMPGPAQRHVKLLKAVNDGPVKYIVLTHGHGDHTGGVRLWKQPGTKVIAQKNHTEFIDYQTRLSSFFALRNAAQFGFDLSKARQAAANPPAPIEPEILFDDKYQFDLGGIRFEIYHTPGETPDHLTVWIPQYKAAFTGDNYYESFPNLYTLRGTQPRWPLDYVSSLNRVLALKPEIVLPSHGRAIQGNPEINRRLTQYRDAILYVHEAVIAGMNQGKDVYTLMREIHLPEALNVGESYGKLTWSVRGIYEGYAGWFDMNPATMYEVPASAVYADVTRLAGGPARLAQLAQEQVQAGNNVEALHTTQIALAADERNRPALQARLQALTALRERCRNTNERGWLDYSIRLTNGRLQETSAGKP
ncbi:MAG: alkyl/aryl-sulfatase [Acidobacteriota bacterium]|nr:alkyl/aryl-sulfatase [Acidobacteriota bacterium]